MQAAPLVQTDRAKRERRSTLPAYLSWAAAWFAFFLFASTVRVGTTLWEPVFRWAYIQGMLLERMGDLGRVGLFGSAFLVYLTVGCVLWVVTEALAQASSASLWIRSGVAWGLLQIGLMVLFMFTT